MGLRSKFALPPSEKNGFQVDDCHHPREQRILQFLVSIFNPDKPTTVTMQVIRAIYGAYTGDRVCGWHHLIDDMVQRKFRKVESKKGCPLASFLLDLYARHGVLTPDETHALELQRE